MDARLFKIQYLTMAKQLYEVLEGLLRVRGCYWEACQGRTYTVNLLCTTEKLDWSCWPGGCLNQCAGKFMYLQYPSGIDVFHWAPVQLSLYWYSDTICILFSTPYALTIARFYNIEICCAISLVPGIKNSWNWIIGGCVLFISVVWRDLSISFIPGQVNCKTPID